MQCYLNSLNFKVQMVGKCVIWVTGKVEQRYMEFRDIDSSLYPRWGYSLTDAEFVSLMCVCVNTLF